MIWWCKFPKCALFTIRFEHCGQLWFVNWDSCCLPVLWCVVKCLFSVLSRGYLKWPTGERCEEKVSLSKQRSLLTLFAILSARSSNWSGGIGLYCSVWLMSVDVMSHCDVILSEAALSQPKALGSVTSDSVEAELSSSSYPGDADNTCVTPTPALIFSVSSPEIL